MTTAVVATGELFRKTLRQVPRVMPDVVQAILIPLFFFALLSLQFQSIAKLPGFPPGSYAAFLLPQIIVFTAFTSANGAGYALVLEVKSGYLDKLRAMPIPRSSILMGRLLGVGVRAMAQALLILLVALAVGIRIATGLAGYAGILVLAALVAMSWAAIMSWIGLTTRSPEAVEASSVLFLPLTYVTTGSIPIEYMAPVLQGIVRFNPITYVVEGIRALSMGGGASGALAFAFLAAAGLACFGLGIATLAMRRMDSA